jgi:hypothetical protein
MADDRARYITGRSVSLICVLVAIVVIAGCFINPRGIYGSWELTFGIGVFLAFASALSAAYFHSRLISGSGTDNP